MRKFNELVEKNLIGVNEAKNKKVYVLYEEDRGMGVTILGVYTDYHKAEAELNSSSRYGLEEVDFYN